MTNELHNAIISLKEDIKQHNDFLEFSKPVEGMSVVSDGDFLISMSEDGSGPYVKLHINQDGHKVLFEGTVPVQTDPFNVSCCTKQGAMEMADHMRKNNAVGEDKTFPVVKFRDAVEMQVKKNEATLKVLEEVVANA